MTTAQIQDLRENSLRLKVAELLGWTRKQGNYNSRSRIWPPHYTKDLNSCHLFEVAMSDQDAFRYGHELLAIVTRDEGRALVSATAIQRCEAFVRVMEAK